MGEFGVSMLECRCPYCGEWIDVQVDASAGSKQQFVSDCDVCCRPIEFLATVDQAGDVSLQGRRDSEGHY